MFSRLTGWIQSHLGTGGVLNAWASLSVAAGGGQKTFGREPAHGLGGICYRSRSAMAREYAREVTEFLNDTSTNASNRRGSARRDRPDCLQRTSVGRREHAALIIGPARLRRSDRCGLHRQGERGQRA